jgi:hypothetical protein
VKTSLAAAAVLFVASPALASDSFPAHLDTFLTLGYEPECTICHQTLLGGFGTATQPFGEAMRSRGLVAGNLGSLEGAVQALDGENSDVDGDGVEDIQELRDGTNPNPIGDVDPPEYGCLGSIAPAGSGFAGALVALAGVAFVGLRRRRMSSRESTLLR